MRLLVIVNPAAGSRAHHWMLDQLLMALSTSIGNVVITERSGDACRAGLEACQDKTGYTAIVIAGGDGTVNEVVNGLHIGQEQGYSSPPFGIVPCGTQNVLAQELGYASLDACDWMRILERGTCVSIDIGLAGDRCFCLMAGFGFDAAVIDGVRTDIKSALGSGAYAVSAFQTIGKYSYGRFRIVVDGRVINTDAYLVVVANSPSYGFHKFRMAPFAVMTDGWLDICVFKRQKRRTFGFIGQLFAIGFKRHLREPGVVYLRGKVITVGANPDVACQVDGDPHGTTPTEIRILPEHLKVLQTSEPVP